MSKTVQPKIAQKMAMRFAIGLLVIAGLVFAYRWITTDLKDPDFGTFNSVGYITALKEVDNNLEAVLIDPKGQVIDNPDYKPDFNDTLAVWGPKGQRVFVVSDRENGESHIFRWNPSSEKMERKSLDSRGKTFLSFAVPGSPEGSKTALLLSGGTVLEYDPTTGEATQILPPRSRDMAGAGGDEGATSQFEMLYQALGHSFTRALWGLEKNGIFAVLKRDDGEVLVWQDLTAAKGPMPIAFGRSIEFDVSPSTGMVVYSVQGFQKPPKPEQMDQREYDAMARVFEHLLGIFTPNAATEQPIVATPTKEDLTFGNPAFSPDGSTVAFTYGKTDIEGNYKPDTLAIVPAKSNSPKDVNPIDKGEIYGVSWHPNGKMLVYTKTENGKSSIYTLDITNGTKTNITGDKGSFRSPRFSPQE